MRVGTSTRLLVGSGILFALTTIDGTTAGRGALQQEGSIVFESTRTGDSDVWITTPDGRQQTNLTRNPQVEDATPALSPDGKRVAFVRSRGNRYELWVMNADGTQTRRLGLGKGSDLNPAWSPSGDRIAFATLESGSWNLVVTTLTGQRRRLTSDSATELDASWDPSGERLVFDRIVKGTSDLWTISADGGSPTQLTRTPSVAEVSPAWSPDGEEIAYAATVNGVYDLYAVSVDAQRVRRLTRDAADDGDPAWAPDGTALAYRRGVGPDYEIAIVDSSGSGRPRNVTRNASGIDVKPSWAARAPRLVPRRLAEAQRLSAISWVFACDAAWPGTPGNDSYWGNALVNFMCGDGGVDTIRGLDAGDWMNGGTGTGDRLYGYSHADKLKVRDSTKGDYAWGGYGADYALLDTGDSTDVEYPSY